MEGTSFSVGVHESGAGYIRGYAIITEENVGSKQGTQAWGLTNTADEDRRRSHNAAGKEGLPMPCQGH